ncbi:MAG: hypothetical protein ABL900_03345 [Burkholderiaceae bacterium]
MKTVSSSLAGTLGSLLVAISCGAPAFAHWPGQPAHQFAELGELKLESGEVIKNVRMSYMAHGKLNAAKDNAILYMHGFAQNHHSIDHLIGPGRPLDTERYFIICPDTLGTTQTNFEQTTSPSKCGRCGRVCAGDDAHTPFASTMPTSVHPHPNKPRARSWSAVSS